MRSWLRFSLLFTLLFVVIFSSLPIIAVKGSSSPYIYVKITDNETGDPIRNATIVIWDMDTLRRPELGEGIYFTDENGEYNITGPYVVPDHTYVLSAYRANVTGDRWRSREITTADYVPVINQFQYPYGASSVNISLQLLPGALIKLEGIVYAAQSSGLSTQLIITVIDPQTGQPPHLNFSYLSEYDSFSEWFLGTSRRYVIVPSNVPLLIKAETSFYSRLEGFIPVTFIIKPEEKPFFNLTKGFTEIYDLSDQSLIQSYEFVSGRINTVSSLLDEAQSVGFIVISERRDLAEAQNQMIQAESLRNEGKYNDSWVALRTAYTQANIVSMTLGNMRLISLTSAVYLPAVLAIFAVILAFFLFENNRKKMISSVIIYIIFLFVFYWIYPGAQLIMKENATTFLEAAATSLIATLAIVFGAPRVWKERQVEGEVSLRSAISIIFSMAKRQIKRKKLRGFFTIASMIILILAFTSLTSFGVVFGIVSNTVSSTPPSQGILVKQLVNETSIVPLPLGDPTTQPALLAEVLNIKNVARRVDSTLRSEPIAYLINPNTQKSVEIYGIAGIDPANESLYTPIDELIENGAYLDENKTDEILISASLAASLNIGVDEDVSLYISPSIVRNLTSSFTVKGLLNDEEYDGLIDLDGQPFGPLRLLSDGTLRVCNSTEVVVMNWQAFISLQDEANILMGGNAPQFTMLSEIVFEPADWNELQSIINTLVLYVFNYDVFVSFNNVITHYFIGSYMEAKGVAELMIPLVMVGLNVGAVMMNAVYERRKEIRILSMLGLNPVHVAAIFVAEAIVVGMVGGGLGYLFGLGFYRLINLFGTGLMIREKLEWWWSAIGFGIAILASILSAIRPAALAVSMYTPSKVRKLKITEEEAVARKEEIFKVFQARELSMPAKIKMNEKPFFLGFIANRLNELKRGAYERVENIEETPEIENVKGELVKTIKFDYFLVVSGQKRGTKNELIIVKSPDEDYHRVRLVCTPASPGTPMTMIDRTIDFVHTLTIEWVRDRKRIIGA